MSKQLKIDNLFKTKKNNENITKQNERKTFVHSWQSSDPPNMTLDQFMECTNIKDIIIEDMKKCLSQSKFKKELKNLDIYIEQFFEWYMTDESYRRHQKKLKFSSKPWLTTKDRELIAQHNLNKRCYINMYSDNFAKELTDYILNLSVYKYGNEYINYYKETMPKHVYKAFEKHILKGRSQPEIIKRLKREIRNWNKSIKIKRKTVDEYFKDIKAMVDGEFSDEMVLMDSSTDIESEIASSNKPRSLSKQSKTIKKRNKIVRLEDNHSDSATDRITSSSKPCPLSKRQKKVNTVTVVSNSEEPSKDTVICTSKPCPLSKKGKYLQKDVETESVESNSKESSKTTVMCSSKPCPLSKKRKHLQTDIETDSVKSNSEKSSKDTVICASKPCPLSKKRKYLQKDVETESVDSSSKESSKTTVICSSKPCLQSKKVNHLQRVVETESVESNSEQSSKNTLICVSIPCELSKESRSVKKGSKISLSEDSSTDNRECLNKTYLLPVEHSLIQNNFEAKSIGDNNCNLLNNKIPENVVSIQKNIEITSTKNHFERSLANTNVLPSGIDSISKELPTIVKKTIGVHSDKNNISQSSKNISVNLDKSYSIFKNASILKSLNINSVEQNEEQFNRNNTCSNLSLKPAKFLELKRNLNHKILNERLELLFPTYNKEQKSQVLNKIRNSNHNKIIKRNHAKHILFYTYKCGRNTLPPQNENDHIQSTEKNIEKQQPQKENLQIDAENQQVQKENIQMEVDKQGTLEKNIKKEKSPVVLRFKDADKIINAAGKLPATSNDNKEKIISVTDISPKSMSLNDYKKYTNIYEYMRNDILKKFPNDSNKYLCNLEKFVEQFYFTSFIKQEKWLKRLLKINSNVIIKRYENGTIQFIESDNQKEADQNETNRKEVNHIEVDQQKQIIENQSRLEIPEEVTLTIQNANSQHSQFISQELFSSLDENCTQEKSTDLNMSNISNNNDNTVMSIEAIYPSQMDFETQSEIFKDPMQRDPINDGNTLPTVSIPVSIVAQYFEFGSNDQLKQTYSSKENFNSNEEKVKDGEVTYEDLDTSNETELEELDVKNKILCISSYENDVEYISPTPLHAITIDDVEISIEELSNHTRNFSTNQIIIDSPHKNTANISNTESVNQQRNFNLDNPIEGRSQSNYEEIDNHDERELHRLKVNNESLVCSFHENEFISHVSNHSISTEEILSDMNNENCEMEKTISSSNILERSRNHQLEESYYSEENFNSNITIQNNLQLNKEAVIRVTSEPQILHAENQPLISFNCEKNMDSNRIEDHVINNEEEILNPMNKSGTNTNSEIETTGIESFKNNTNILEESQQKHQLQKSQTHLRENFTLNPSTNLDNIQLNEREIDDDIEAELQTMEGKYEPLNWSDYENDVEFVSSPESVHVITIEDDPVSTEEILNAMLKSPTRENYTNQKIMDSSHKSDVNISRVLEKSGNIMSSIIHSDNIEPLEHGASKEKSPPIQNASNNFEFDKELIPVDNIKPSEALETIKHLENNNIGDFVKVISSVQVIENANPSHEGGTQQQQLLENQLNNKENNKSTEILGSNDIESTKQNLKLAESSNQQSIQKNENIIKTSVKKSKKSNNKKLNTKKKIVKKKRALQENLQNHDDDIVPQKRHKFNPLVLIQTTLPSIGSNRFEKRSESTSSSVPIDVDYLIEDASQILSSSDSNKNPSVTDLLNVDNTFFNGLHHDIEVVGDNNGSAPSCSNAINTINTNSPNCCNTEEEKTLKHSSEQPQTLTIDKENCENVTAIPKRFLSSLRFGSITHLQLHEVILSDKKSFLQYESSVPFLESLQNHPAINATINFRSNGFNQLNVYGSSLCVLLGLSQTEWKCFRNILEAIENFRYRRGDEEPVNESLPYRILYYLFKTLPKFSQVNFEFNDSNCNYVTCLNVNTSYFQPIDCLSKALNISILESMEKVKSRLLNQ